MNIDTACRTVREHGPGTYAITLPDGKTVRKRLFCNPGSTLLCEFLPRKRRKGTPLSPAIISAWISVCKEENAKKEKSSFDVFRHNFEKIVRYTSASGLWPGHLTAAKAFLTLPDNDQRAFHALLTTPNEQRHKDWSAWYEKTCKEADRLGFGKLSVDELEALCRPNGIKSIPYQHPENDTAFMANAIRTVIETKSPHSGLPIEKSFLGISWRSPRYDHSARVRWDNTAQEPRGWYDEEYHGCGNGYYWLLLDASHAMFCEKD